MTKDGELPGRLRSHVAALEGVRHPVVAAPALRAAEAYVAETLHALGLTVERRPFRFEGVEHRNVVATKAGRAAEAARLLVGAHIDTVAGSPGADDNASGVAAMLEAARALAASDLRATVELVGFNLEEPQGLTYRVGSRVFAADARRRRVRYAGALVLEMVGYTDRAEGSQQVPVKLFWKRVPRTGTFLAATGDGRSARLLRTFARAARDATDLEVITYRTPMRGWLVPETRLSDNASFWDRGYSALMVTDTAFLRNPYYHTPADRIDTLDFEFMGKVVEAVVRTVTVLAS